MNLALITVASHASGYFRDLMRTARQAGFEPVVLGWGLPYASNATKISQIFKFLHSRDATASHYLFCDGFDTVIAQPREVICDRFRKLEAPIVFSAETNCYPCAEFKPMYPRHDAPYRFLNSGVWIGEQAALIGLFKAAEQRLGDGSPSDQEIFTEIFLTSPGTIVLDYNCEIAQSLFNTESNLERTSTGIRNKLTGASPCVFHGNGKTSLDQIRSWLREAAY